MREIKFRGNDGCEWRYSEVVLNDTDYLNGNKSEIRFMCVGEVEDWEDGWVSVCYIGQYTGKNDENGKEIYEGDIVTVTCYSYEEIESETTGIVEYSEELFGFGLSDGENGWVMLSELQGPYRTVYEVVGNIYENKELLN